MAAGLRHDVGALDAAAAAHRPGDDDLPEIPAAHQLRAAAGGERVAAGGAVRGAGVLQVPAGGTVPAAAGAGGGESDDDAEHAAGHGHAELLEHGRHPRRPGAGPQGVSE